MKGILFIGFVQIVYYAGTPHVEIISLLLLFDSFHIVNFFSLRINYIVNNLYFSCQHNVFDAMTIVVDQGSVKEGNRG